MIGADEKLVDELDDFMDMDYGGPFSKKNRKKYSLTSKLLLWRRTRQMPMAESLIKTGWGESLLRVLETRRGDIQQQINFRSKTYYGVFGLNRAELNAVGEKDFNKVCNAKKWKGQGVAITPENMKQLAEVLSDYTLINLCEKYGARPTLKYLRQVSRRSGAANGEVKRQIAYDWEDYIRMAKKVGVDLKVESNRYPLQLARRHNEMMAVIREKDAAASAERRREMAVSLDKKFGVAKVMKRIRKLYEYKDERYSIIVPADVFDIVKDSTFLGHCVANTNRYYERISSEESYIVFLRQTDKPNRPWYTLEIEPGGTIRQKRSYSNEQYSDLQEAVPFLKEWQQVVQKRMDEKERKLAVESKEKRNKEFEELTVNGNIMRNVSVDAEELIAAIKRVGYAVSLNPNLPAMTGIYFKAENGKLNLVGCDGSQLAKVEFPYEEDFHFILPNETAKSLAALDLHGQCQITGDHKKAVFSTEDYTLTTSLICGEYMNYESVIPKAGKYDVVFDRDSLLGAATRVKNLMDLKHREPVVLHIDGESCYITSRLTGVEFHEDVLCQGTIPEPMNIAFDDILLLNGISATKGEGIRALLNSSLSPMKIENEGFTALVLPVRMKNRA